MNAGYVSYKHPDGTTVYQVFFTIMYIGISLNIRWPIQTSVGFILSMFPLRASLDMGIGGMQLGYLGDIAVEHS